VINAADARGKLQANATGLTRRQCHIWP